MEQTCSQKFAGGYLKNVDLILLGSGAAEEYMWCVHCPHS